MSSVLSVEDRNKICEKFSAIKDEDAGRYGAQMDKMSRAVRDADKQMLSDILADENLIPEKFRTSALKVERHAINGLLPPEFFSVMLFDAISFDLDPWENVKLRGWEFGQPKKVQRVKLKPTTDPLESSLQRILRGHPQCVKALEKIRQVGLANAWQETVEAVTQPLILLETKERAQTKNEKVSQELRSLVEQFGEKAVEDFLVEWFTAVATNQIIDEELNPSPLAQAFFKLNDDLW